jgi:hypothetical protein
MGYAETSAVCGGSFGYVFAFFEKEEVNSEIEFEY